MAVYGIVDSHFIDLPANIDARYLQTIQTADGVSFAELIPRINAALAAFNGRVDPLVAEFIQPPSTRVTIQGRGPGAFKVTRSSQHDPGRPQRPGKGFAHALPIFDNDVSMEWTEEGLRAMPSDLIVQEIEEALTGFNIAHRRDVLARLLDNAEVPVDDVNGTTMVSPGFAGSGSGVNAFQPTLFPDLTAIPGGYSHYNVVAAAAIAAGLKAARDKQRKWNATGHFDVLGSEAFVNLITALGEAGGFVRTERLNIRESANNSFAQIDAENYLGIFDGDVWIRKPIADYTEAHGVLWQPKGRLQANNPLAWRYNPIYGRGVYLRSRDLWPMSQATLKQKMGIGVADRTGAQLIMVANSGPYAPPVGFTAG